MPFEQHFSSLAPDLSFIEYSLCRVFPACFGYFAFKGNLFHDHVHRNHCAPPPLAPLTDDEQMKLIANLAQEDRWLDGFIERLTAAIRDIKH